MQDQTGYKSTLAEVLAAQCKGTLSLADQSAALRGTRVTEIQNTTEETRKNQFSAKITEENQETIKIYKIPTFCFRRCGNSILQRFLSIDFLHDSSWPRSMGSYLGVYVISSNHQTTRIDVSNWLIINSYCLIQQLLVNHK